MLSGNTPPFFQVSIFCNGEPVFFEFAGSQMEPYSDPLKPLLIAEPQGCLGGVDLCGPLDPSQDQVRVSGFNLAGLVVDARGGATKPTSLLQPYLLYVK